MKECTTTSFAIRELSLVVFGESHEVSREEIDSALYASKNGVLTGLKHLDGFLELGINILLLGLESAKSLQGPVGRLGVTYSPGLVAPDLWVFFVHV